MITIDKNYGIEPVEVTDGDNKLTITMDIIKVAVDLSKAYTAFADITGPKTAIDEAKLLNEVLAQYGLPELNPSAVDNLACAIIKRATDLKKSHRATLDCD